MKRIGIALLLVFASCLSSVSAQDYPNKPIRIIVPFSPGGTTDVMARLLAQEMTKTFNENVIVENRTGGGGIVGTTAISRAEADGYTIGIVPKAHALNPGLHASLPYDSAKDFVAISLLLRVPNVIAVNASHPAKSLQDFLELARQQPGTLNYGSAGVGTAQHIAGALLSQMANVKLVHVPYRGGSLALQDLMGGQLVSSIHGINVVAPMHRTNRVRALVVTGLKRSAALPDVPSASETIPGYESIDWYGMVGPAGMPHAAVVKLQQVINRALSAPAIKERFVNDGVELVGNTPEEFDAFLKAELKRWPPIVRKLNAKAD